MHIPLTREQLAELQLAELPVFDSIRGTSARLGIGSTSIYDLAGQGLIETKKLGKKVLIRQTSVLAYVESLRPAPINLTARRRRAMAKAEETKQRQPERERAARR
jgi:hypothetical protein